MSTIGIIAALHEEIDGVLARMENVVTRDVGRRTYHTGLLRGQQCVLVLARIGKVAAAATTLTLIREFNASAVVFAGVAGGVGEGVRVGDIVVASQLLQHDMDASPIFPRHEIPLLGVSRFSADPDLTAAVHGAASQFISNDFATRICGESRERFALDAPKVHQGLTISGDQFINDTQGVLALRGRLPDALCVEMEGAAVAQICFEYGVPFAVFRTISDRADDGASTDFSAFLNEVARFYSFGVLLRLVGLLATHSSPSAVQPS